MDVAGTQGDVVAWGWSTTGRRLEGVGGGAARRLDGEEDDRRWLVDKGHGRRSDGDVWRRGTHWSKGALGEDCYCYFLMNGC